MNPRPDKRHLHELKIDTELPSPRGVALAVMRLTRQDDVSINELVRVISGDPAIVGRLIKAANGLAFSHRRPVVSVPESLMVLGLSAVRAMVTGFSLLSEYRGGQCEEFNYESFWSESLALALGMQALARHCRAGPADELFSLGLLLRVGELGLATLYPAQYGNVLRDAAHGERGLLELERAAFATDHAELGGQMLTEWGLPEIFVGSAQRYLEGADAAALVAESRSHRVFDALRLARLFSLLCVSAPDRSAMLLDQILDEAAQAGYTADKVLSDLREMHALWFEWCDFLALDCGACAAFPEAGVAPAAADEKVKEASAVKVAVRARERLAREDEDTPVRVLVVDADTEHRAAVIALLIEEGCEVIECETLDAGLQQTFELLPHMLVLGGGEGRRAVLTAIEELRGVRIGRPMHILLHAADMDEGILIEGLETGADDVVRYGAPVRVLQARLRAGLREVELRRELERERKELRGYAAELAVLNRQLQEVALTDELTGFRNRRYAIERMQQEWAAAGRRGTALSLLVVDVDELKAINDAHGHDAGDRALCLVADAMRTQVRGEDVICRTGGDEFVVICPASDVRAARLCAERLREAVCARALDLGDGKHCSLSVSIGVAERRASQQTPEDLLKLADRGAYLAKGSGRNRVECIQLEQGQ